MVSVALVFFFPGQFRSPEAPSVVFVRVRQNSASHKRILACFLMEVPCPRGGRTAIKRCQQLPNSLSSATCPGAGVGTLLSLLSLPATCLAFSRALVDQIPCMSSQDNLADACVTCLVGSNLAPGVQTRTVQLLTNHQCSHSKEHEHQESALHAELLLRGGDSKAVC